MVCQRLWIFIAPNVLLHDVGKLASLQRLLAAIQALFIHDLQPVVASELQLAFLTLPDTHSTHQLMLLTPSPAAAMLPSSSVFLHPSRPSSSVTCSQSWQGNWNSRLHTHLQPFTHALAASRGTGAGTLSYSLPQHTLCSTVHCICLCTPSPAAAMLPSCSVCLHPSRFSSSVTYNHTALHCMVMLQQPHLLQQYCLPAASSCNHQALPHQ